MPISFKLQTYLYVLCSVLTVTNVSKQNKEMLRWFFVPFTSSKPIVFIRHVAAFYSPNRCTLVLEFAGYSIVNEFQQWLSLIIWRPCSQIWNPGPKVSVFYIYPWRHMCSLILSNLRMAKLLKLSFSWPQCYQYQCQTSDVGTLSCHCA